MNHINRLETKLNVTCTCPVKRNADGTKIRNCVCGDGIWDIVKGAVNMVSPIKIPDSKPTNQQTPTQTN